MSTETTNLKLVKPAENETADINIINNNMDIIDSHLNDLTKKVDNIKIPDGTTAEKGIVQLEDSISSTSTNKAATANSVKNAYDKGVSAYNLANTANGNANNAMSRANEAFQSASNGKTAIAGVLGYVSGGNTHQELANEAQYCKNIMANNLNAKGVGANGNYALRDLANSIGSISIESLGGVRFATGKVGIPNTGDNRGTISLGFTPNLIAMSATAQTNYHAWYNSSIIPILSGGIPYRVGVNVSSSRIVVYESNDIDVGSNMHVHPIDNGFIWRLGAQGAPKDMTWIALKI